MGAHPLDKPKQPPPPKSDKEEEPPMTKDVFEEALKKASRQTGKPGRVSY